MFTVGDDTITAAAQAAERERAADARPPTRREIFERVIAAAVNEGILKADGEDNTYRFSGRQYQAVVAPQARKGAVLL